MNLVLPLPPSMNTYWRSTISRRVVRVLLSADGRKFKAHCRLVAQAQRVSEQEGEVSVTGTIFMARAGCDLDNRIKPLLDALSGICYADDKQVAHIDLRRDIDRDNPRAEISIEPLGAA